MGKTGAHANARFFSLMIDADGKSTSGVLAFSARVHAAA